MGLKDFADKIKQEINVLKGEESKDKLYFQENTFPDEPAAREAYEQAKNKLFNVNAWSDLPGINSGFKLYEPNGTPAAPGTIKKGQFIKIVLPGPAPENWVEITDLRVGDNEAEFVVHPSPAPIPLTENHQEVKHFFTKEASSTFRVERQGLTLRAYEIGRNEGINNQGAEAGDRALVNTLIAEGGWAGFQAVQWDKLTAYLVHQIEITPDK